ncbi:hypothetical protein TCON_0581 [Astathelohania contejeani]|uniref:Homologous recombination OB-fold protein OB-fold domain-containing protein n=1 Tax=Astathelohania contejeani TaxID=164912 RepID=A0ABQ7I162_9MICR|nr:hypothetical protein TCON_0581 [Thelohania contejeani]
MEDANELLKKIRSTNEETRQNINIETIENISDDESEYLRTKKTLSQSNIIRKKIKIESSSKEEENTQTLHSSQMSSSQILDLNKIKNDLENSITIDKIKFSSDYKINNTLCAIVKKIERFNSSVCSLTLLDSTGEIGASIYYSLVEKYDIKVGSAITIHEFGLWKLDTGNHINIVDTNID